MMFTYMGRVTKSSQLTYFMYYLHKSFVHAKNNSIRKQNYYIIQKYLFSRHILQELTSYTFKFT